MTSRTLLPLSAGMLAMVCVSGCVHPVHSSWRLANNVLIPPGISQPTVAQGTVKAEAAAHAACPPNVRARHNQVRVTVTRDSLSKQPRGWLTAWTEDLEAQGCIAPGEALRLADSIAQSLPLEINAAFRILYPTGSVELGPRVRLQVMTPIMVEGAAPDAPIIEVASSTVSGNVEQGIAVNIDARATSNLSGYETASYSVQARSHAPGVSIAVTSAERHINGQTQRVATPIHNYFQSLGAASFYGLFYKGGDTEFTALLIGAPTKADLDRRTNLLAAGFASCEALNNDSCIPIPKRVAINPMVLVTVNGVETTLNWGATVGAAIRAAGEQRLNLNPLLPQLSVFKPYGDRMAPLQFDQSDSAILNLILMGGETISWK